MHDVRILDHLVPEPGAFYVMDRGYVDFERLGRLDDAGSFFVTRAKSNMKARRRYSRPVDRSTGLICDQTIVLTGFYTRQGFDRPLRRIKFNDPETGKSLVFLTNNFVLPALTIAKLYKYRWQVELFFKWIKQHLRIKAFAAYQKTPSNPKFGRQFVFMCSSPSSKNGLASPPAFTKFYRF